ncbi:MAG TPA: hypothetical protein PLC15_02150 [Candidatus Obscuribacter sp.]|nr:hypothetical protein [Candidatus Obscuribacter sp.]MBK9282519.1 hypothetical protein [Candidatus Obscuribacter sp.]HMW89411.1 hypothetical protein [Candidatus Obscuribacter sp.]HMX44375.1 hypothetical protein [Candidatus Obscuribacter sp.]HMY52324.1 hypothetical protein [Candidatus Obscuribacter sp.]
MYINPTALIVLFVLFLILWQSFRYLTYRVAHWLTVAAMVFIALAIINPAQTKVMVHHLWYWLLDAVHNIIYVLS